MTHAQAIAFLQAHQPMPSDEDITAEQRESYLEAIAYFAAHPDPDSIPLFLARRQRVKPL